MTFTIHLTFGLVVWAIWFFGNGFLWLKCCWEEHVAPWKIQGSDEIFVFTVITAASAGFLHWLHHTLP